MQFRFLTPFRLFAPFPTTYHLPPTTFFLLCILFSYTSQAHAAAAVQRRIQMQKQAQAEAAAQYQQQMIAQQQAAYAQAYQQQAAAQQKAAYAQAYQQAAAQKAAAEYAAYKQAMAQAMAQRQAELQAAQQVKTLVAQKQAQQIVQAQQAAAYRQAGEVIQYKQAQEAQKMLQTKQQAQLNSEVRQYAELMVKRKAMMEAQAVGAAQMQVNRELAEYNQYQQIKAAQAKAEINARLQAQAAKNAVGSRMAAEVLASKAEEKSASPIDALPETLVDIQDLWRALDISSKAWLQIIDDETKTLTVSEFIDRFAKNGITIKKAPGYYARFIDSLMAQMPDMVDAPFMNILYYAAVAEYDFENGTNKDELARKVLGESAFQANKARLLGK